MADDAPRYRKPNLPTKTCAVCGRPFAWRKKWARDWAHVTTCSERCRRTRRSAGSGAPETPPDGRATARP